MKITKLGHCCLLIEEQGKRILTDPGVFSTSQNELENIDIILVTHEHQDHFHVESVKKILEKNPQVIIVTNKTVGELLAKQEIAHQVLVHGQTATIKKIFLEAFGTVHAEFYRAFPPIENTGYMISNRFFYPGDAFTLPNKKVEILALPVAGPWMKFSEAIEYALLINPKHAFAVHEAILADSLQERFSMMPGSILNQKNISFAPLRPGQTREFG